MSDPFVGKLTYFRVYSGKVKAGDRVLNTTTGKTERIGRILQMHANHREEREEIGAGDIAAGVGLKSTTTGDTLAIESSPIILESMTFPEPVISVAVEPKSKADQDKLGNGLARLSDEDPTFRVTSDEETGQTLIAGMGELHLEIIVDRLKREFNVDANVGRPQVAYRETISKPAEKIQGKFVRQTGGSGQYGDAVINLLPQEPGKGYEFVDKIVGGKIPKEYIKPIDEGIREAMGSGVLAGYPVVDVKVELIDGSYHDVDSSERAFKIAGSMAFKEAMKRAKPKLLEPVMAVEVTTPGGLPRRRDGQPEQPPRPHREHVAGRERSGDQGERPAERDVRLRHRPAVDVTGPRRLHHAVRPVRRGAGVYRKRDHRADLGIQVKGRKEWPSRSSSARSRTSTSAPSGTSTTGRRR